MNIAQYFFDHYIMLIELIGLTALLSSGVHLPEETKKATRTAVFLIIFESIAWSIELWTQNHDGHELLRSMLSACVYSMHPFIVIAIIDMIAPIGRYKVLLYVPTFFYVPLIFTSQWTHIVYYIDYENRWHSGGEFSRFIPYFAFFAYTLIFIVLFMKKYIRYNLHTMLGVLYIVAAGLIGVAVNMLRDSSTDYANMFASVIVLYYLFLYQHVSRIDYLTGMMNRQAFYHDMKQEGKSFTAACSVDMNELKWINDSKGHEAGDIALKTVDKCLVKHSGPHKKAYRVGGDEFIILYIGKSEWDVQADISEMRGALLQTEYVCAFGYCMVTEETDLENALRNADKAMYEDKSRLKQAVLAAGGQLHRRASDR